MAKANKVSAQAEASAEQTGDNAAASQAQTTGSASTSGGDKPAAPAWKKARGARVRVLDWSRDPQNPVECDGVIDAVNSDGTVDISVQPPVGIEPYVQTGLTECTAGAQRCGQWKRPS